jgi:hypothetical protein
MMHGIDYIYKHVWSHHLSFRIFYISVHISNNSDSSDYTQYKMIANIAFIFWHEIEKKL